MICSQVPAILFSSRLSPRFLSLARHFSVQLRSGIATPPPSPFVSILPSSLHISSLHSHVPLLWPSSSPVRSRLTVPSPLVTRRSCLSISSPLSLNFFVLPLRPLSGPRVVSFGVPVILCCLVPLVHQFIHRALNTGRSPCWHVLSVSSWSSSAGASRLRECDICYAACIDVDDAASDWQEFGWTYVTFHGLATGFSMQHFICCVCSLPVAKLPLVCCAPGAQDTQCTSACFGQLGLPLPPSIAIEHYVAWFSTFQTIQCNLVPNRRIWFPCSGV